MEDRILREQLAKALSWQEAHVGWKKVVSDLPVKDRGTRPAGVPHSPWELLEHMRIATWDMLEFCRNAKHVSPDWPSGYWPQKPAPPDSSAWDKSVKSLEKDLDAMEEIVTAPGTNLSAPIPGGSGQTILREILLIADHNAYHLGQLVLVRQLLGCWPDN